MASLGFLCIFLVHFLPINAVVPSPQSIGSDLTIITHNDLYSNFTTRRASNLVLSSQCNHSTAAAKCAALGTSLWDPNSCSQALDYLQYLDYAKASGDVGVYWVMGKSKSDCRAMDTHGHLRQYPCNTQLPVLCSNTVTDGNRQVSVMVNNATITGRREESSSSFRFLGIKYASIPARFAPSEYHPPMSGSNITALDYAPQCIQSGCGVEGGPSCTEDCLTLNIWTPYLPNGNSDVRKSKAVMLWIHGGGFTSGTGSDPTFDGSAMASRGDVVLVTINYRLSTLGFLALSNTTLTGNYGLADQNTALDWLRLHIADFGGDPAKITVFGQSAGAASVRALLASPQSREKMSGAIMMSNPQGLEYASTFSKYLTISEATNMTEALITEVGCAQKTDKALVDCLQNADPLALVGFRNASQSFSGTIARYPVVDGTFLTSDSLPLGPSAPKLNISVLAGIMHDDGSPFTSYPTSSNVSNVLSSQGFPASAILSSDAFPIPSNPNTTLAIFNLTSRVATDAMFRCLAQSTAYAATKNAVFKNMYSYEFDRAYQIPEFSPNPPACEAPVTPGYPFGNPNAPYYKCHSGELLSVFGTTIRRGRSPRDQDDVPFSQYIVDTWTAFARTGNPNPNPHFISARTFSNTSMMVKDFGVWDPVRPQRLMLRVLDVEGKGGNKAFREGKQCEILGQPLSYYDV